MENSKIEWTTHTFNPWIGCTRVSPACEHCYAETTADTRYGLAAWGTAASGGTRHVTSRAKWREPPKWDRDAHRAASRARVFCASWADVFEDFAGQTDVGTTLDQERERLFGMIERTEHLDWLLLTKRPENIARMLPAAWGGTMPPNVWLGTTVEDQQRADGRIPHLLQHNSVIRFLSIEPQLGPIDLSRHLPEVDWVIAGGESGGGSRPTQVAWARSVRDQCVAAGVSFFWKQWGNHQQIENSERLIRVITKNGRLLDGRSWDEIPTPRMQRRERMEAAPQPTRLSVWDLIRKPMVG